MESDKVEIIEFERAKTIVSERFDKEIVNYISELFDVRMLFFYFYEFFFFFIVKVLEEIEGNLGEAFVEKAFKACSE